MASELKMLIDGALVDGDRVVEVVNPATGKPFITVARADEGQAARAIAAAKRAQPKWAALSRAERGEYLVRLADAIDADAERLARLLTQEQGKPIAEAKGEIAGGAHTLRHYSTVEIPVEVLRDDADSRIEVHHRPLGVVAAIAPWNYPFLLTMSKVGPALIVGNTVVAKPAPTTPAAVLAFGELVADILPPGVLNIVSDNNDLGAYLSAHPDVAKVSFTGSTATGKKVFASAADSIKRVTLELGGNDAAIVLDDVDVKKTASAIGAAAFRNAGQICIAVKRVYVQDAVYDDVCNELAAFADNIRYGDGLEQGVTMGPIQNAQQFAKAKTYLDVAKQDGKIIAGGTLPEGDGYFVKPTVVRDIQDGSALVDEEQFAPILPVIRFDSIDDVIARANNTKMGLGGSVWASSTDRAYEIASRIDSGTVWVNQHASGGGPDVPFAGAKESGLGVESGQVGLVAYTQISVINVNKR